MFVTISRCFFDYTEVVRHAGNTKYTGFFIHNSVYFFVVHTSFIHQEWNDSWVNIARTSTHDQARQWSEAHCSIDRTTTFDRCQGGTVTQVTCDNTKIGHVFTHQFSATLCNIFVGCTMETVTTDAIIFIVFVRKRIHVSFFRHCLVECSIEYSNLWYVRHDSLASFDTLNVWWVMQWSQ